MTDKRYLLERKVTRSRINNLKSALKDIKKSSKGYKNVLMLAASEYLRAQEEYFIQLERERKKGDKWTVDDINTLDNFLKNYPDCKNYTDIFELEDKIATLMQRPLSSIKPKVRELGYSLLL